MYLEYSKNRRYLCYDIEADGLDPTKIWCIVVIDIFSGETYRFKTRSEVYEKFPRFVAEQGDAIWVGHHILGFDNPTIERLLGVSLALDNCIDTLVLSYLYHPHMPQGHSLDAWGERLKCPKIEFNDWSHYSQRMLEYCEQDVKLNVRVFKKLTERMRRVGFSEFSCWIEHQIRDVINEQERNGFYFDAPKALELYNSLRRSEQQVVDSLSEIFPPKLKPVKSYRYRVKADGTPHSSYFRHLEQYPKLEFNEDGSEYTVSDYFDFNLGSPNQRVERLLDLGWEPTNFTPKGNPKVDEASLVEFADKSGIQEVKALADWLVLNGRANMINTWLSCLEPDQRIHGRVFSCGAGSRRMRHTNPNTANIPGNDAPFGKECRELWTVPEGKSLVGYDAKGLELRVMVHYLQNPQAEEYFLVGDPHQSNADALKVDRRPGKNIFYATIYGASQKKLKTMHPDGRSGKWIKNTLLDSIPGFRELYGKIQAEFKAQNGFLKTIDGGYVRCPSEHAALNYKFQSAGAILMKLAAIYLRDKTRNMDCMKVGDIHDEGQLEVDPSISDLCGKLACESITEAGETLKFNVLMEGDYSVGKTWAETH